MSEQATNTLGSGGGNTGGGNPPATNQGGGQGGGAGGAGGGQGGQGGGGGNATSWLDSLSPEYREDPSLKGYKTADELAKAHIHAQKMIGADKIVVPGKHSTDQDWEQVYAKLGRPESPDKYEFQLDAAHKPEDVKAFKEFAHKSGLLPKQVEALYKFDLQRQQQAKQMQESRYAEIVNRNLDTLKKEWPDNLYQQNLTKADQGMRQFFGDEFVEWTQKCGVNNDPMFIKGMLKIAEAMGEDSLKGEGGASFGVGAEEIQKKINEILGDFKHPYYDDGHAAHNDAVKHVQGLYNELSKRKRPS